MATLDLLNGGYTGKMGKFHGARRSGKYYIRTSNHQPAHPSPRQSAAWLACAALSRMTHTLVRYSWNLLGLSDKNTTRAGAIAHWANGMIAHQNFHPHNWISIIKPGNKCTIGEIAWNINNNMLSTSFITASPPAIPPESTILAFVIDMQGYCGIPASIPWEIPHLELHPPEICYGELYLCSCLIYSYGRDIILGNGDCLLIPSPRIIIRGEHDIGIINKGVMEPWQP